MAWRMEPATGDPQRELKLICMNNLLATSEVRLYFKDLLSRFILLSSGWIAAYAPGRTAAELIGKTDFDVFSYTHANAAFDRRAGDHPHRQADDREAATGDLQGAGGRLGVDDEDAAAG